MKRFKALKIIGIIVAAILVFSLVINLFPPAKVVDENPFVVGKDGLPMVAAHRGGGVNNDERVAALIRENTGARYCRTITSNFSFDTQTNLYLFNPTVYHHDEMDKMFSLGEEFLSMSPDKPQIFYVWGHAFEFDIHDDWGRFEEFLQMMSGKDDIFYGTNKEVLL